MPRQPTVRLQSASFKGWTFVLVAGTVLAVIAIIDRGGLEALTPDGSACEVEVTADTLNVREGPSLEAGLVGGLERGDQVDATSTVVNGYRELDESRWAADRFLRPLSIADCS